MPFEVIFSPSAEIDLDYYRIFEQRIIVDGIKLHSVVDADKETKRRKRLDENRFAAWELRLGDHRVFYEIEGETHVRIIAVGHKKHNDLFIRGVKVLP
jgi:mRNA-degrading endonuclease RelE of RelBE toxin-antitoxin system